MSKLSPGLELLEHVDRLDGELRRLGDVAVAVRAASQRPQRRALAETIAEAPVAVQSRLEQRALLVEVGDRVALTRAPAQQLSAPRQVVGTDEAQCPPVLRGRFAMRAARCRGVAGGGRELEHRVGIVGRFRVVGQARRVDPGVPPLAERGEDTPMKRDGPMRRDRVFDGQPCQLVAKGDTRTIRAQHARGEALVEMLELSAEQHLQQPDLGPLGNARDGVKDPPGAVPHQPGPREDGIANGPWEPSTANGQDLGDKERVAARAHMQDGAIDLVRIGQHAHRAHRKRGQRETADTGTPQLAEHRADWIARSQAIVSIGCDHERGDPAHAGAEQREHVERGLVRPVQILDDDNRRPVRLELAHQRRQTTRGLLTAFDRLRQRTVGHGGHIRERRKRSRGPQGVTPPPENTRRHARMTETVDERSLADTALTANENQAPIARLRLQETLLEHRHDLLALEQLRLALEIRRCPRQPHARIVLPTQPQRLGNSPYL